MQTMDQIYDRVGIQRRLLEKKNNIVMLNHLSPARNIAKVKIDTLGDKAKIADKLFDNYLQNIINLGQ